MSGQNVDFGSNRIIRKCWWPSTQIKQNIYFLFFKQNKIKKASAIHINWHEMRRILNKFQQKQNGDWHKKEVRSWICTCAESSVYRKTITAFYGLGIEWVVGQQRWRRERELCCWSSGCIIRPHLISQSGQRWSASNSLPGLASIIQTSLIFICVTPYTTGGQHSAILQ